MRLFRRRDMAVVAIFSLVSSNNFLSVSINRLVRMDMNIVVSNGKCLK